MVPVRQRLSASVVRRCARRSRAAKTNDAAPHTLNTTTSALTEEEATDALAPGAAATGAGVAGAPAIDERTGNASGTRMDAPIAAIQTPRRARRHAPKMLSTLAAASPKSAAQSAAYAIQWRIMCPPRRFVAAESFSCAGALRARRPRQR